MDPEKQLHKNNALLRETNKVFRRFVPSGVRQALGLNDITDVEQTCGRAELCVVFADLRNFSTLSESLDPSGVLALVNRYLSFVTPGIQEEGGHVVQYQGDGILAVFPDGTAAALEVRPQCKMRCANALGRLPRFSRHIAYGGRLAFRASRNGLHRQCRAVGVGGDL